MCIAVHRHQSQYHPNHSSGNIRNPDSVRPPEACYLLMRFLTLSEAQGGSEGTTITKNVRLLLQKNRLLKRRVFNSLVIVSFK